MAGYLKNWRTPKAQLALECERPFNTRISRQHIASSVVLNGMRTFLVIIGIWILINVLFVVIMIPPRKPRKSGQPRASSGLAPVPIGQNAYAYDEDERVSLRHTIIAIAMGALFSLTPPLLEAVDDIKRMIGKNRRSQQRAEPASDGSTSDEHDTSKH